MLRIKSVVDANMAGAGISMTVESDSLGVNFYFDAEAETGQSVSVLVDMESAKELANQILKKLGGPTPSVNYSGSL